MGYITHLFYCFIRNRFAWLFKHFQPPSGGILATSSVNEPELNTYMCIKSTSDSKVVVLEESKLSSVPPSTIIIQEDARSTTTSLMGEKYKSFYCAEDNYRYIVPEILQLKELNDTWDFSCTSFDDLS